MRADSLARGAADRLVAAGYSSGAAEARTLLAHVLGTTPAGLLVAPDLSDEQCADFDDLVSRRLSGTPVQHLTGEAWFRTVRLEVGPGVFVPRPETEVMTGWALDRMRDVSATGRRPVVVELCAGSGAITKALAAEGPDADLHAVELSPTAVDYAQRNLEGQGVDLREGDMAEAFGDLDGTVDVVVVNPPYIPLEAWESVQPDVRDHDPELALFSGDDGLVATRVVARVAQRLLVGGGWVCSEHAEVQHESAPQVFAHAGFEHVRDHHDLTGRPRFVTARMPEGFVAGWAS
ncbi:peptide chain release factor N(5)-glutamine methyltransferase [Aestuariimicrobium ganziense]|uniref:peptide chain release factor N(5)-glutamine methyltransferase n=1 Tax=Aestuariimicrobium ganziense TaxID=2773677 RepID=UPI0019422FE0|nr:peptide chain release factor N(5)-glutamine methyltransferase [Aestuariimicrobium ganziense]